LNAADKHFCVSCSVSDCDLCHTIDYCYTCATDFSLNTGTCVSCLVSNCIHCTNIDDCDTCNTSYSLNLDSGGTFNICISCNVSNCSHCTTADVCDTCDDGFQIEDGLCYGCGLAKCKWCVDCLIKGLPCSGCIPTLFLYN
jgi:hypothetical protein